MDDRLKKTTPMSCRKADCEFRAAGHSKERKTAWCQNKTAHYGSFVKDRSGLLKHQESGPVLELGKKKFYARRRHRRNLPQENENEASKSCRQTASSHTGADTAT